jgi:hypothetical protein
MLPVLAADWTSRNSEMGSGQATPEKGITSQTLELATELPDFGQRDSVQEREDVKLWFLFIISDEEKEEEEE